jgi:formylglycine-generating enzyme required for sulfatase activity
VTASTFIRSGFAMLVLTVTACRDAELPPLGEAVVVVDTDLPVPRVASRLRVDLYEDNGRWFESREIARPDPRDWPTSFSVQASNDSAQKNVLVRVRVGGERAQDYRGAERLLRDGLDVTPATEPLPGLVVDRLLRVVLRPGERGSIRVLAAGACAGVPAVLPPGPASTCVDQDAESVPVVPSEMEADLSTPRETRAGSLASSACPVTSAEDRVCIEGGAFVLGTDNVSVVADQTLPPSPERVVRVSTFAIDRDELSVARYRAALERGFLAPAAVLETTGSIGTARDTTCTYGPLSQGREEYALTCIPWTTARALCMFLGGDLPTEAQWEYAATAASRTGKTQFPWGDEPPDCERAVYGRLTLAALPGGCEKGYGSGPRPIAIGGVPVAPRDVSAAGVRGMGGGVSEWVRDVAQPYTAQCWQQRRVNPECVGPDSEPHIVRGGAWGAPAVLLRGASRLSQAGQSSFTGLRCVYAVAP